MADNLHIRRPQDPLQININEDWEVEYWTKKWGITKTQLIAAVKANGTRTGAVAKALGKAP